MKKKMYGLLAAVMMTSLMTACASKPSEEDVRSALKNGTLTVEDAVDKGYVTDEWAAEYIEGQSVEAKDKFSVNLLGAFTTQDVTGAEFTFTPSDTPVLFAFADPEDGESLAKIQAIENDYEDIKAAGGDVILVLMGEKAPEELADGTIPTIFYTDDIKNQLGSNQEMIDGNPFSSSWNMKGSFITAWYRSLDQADLPQTAKDLLDAFGQEASGDGEEVLAPAGMVG